MDKLFLEEKKYTVFIVRSLKSLEAKRVKFKDFKQDIEKSTPKQELIFDIVEVDIIEIN